MPRVAELLTVKELAAKRGVHPSTIRRQLHALDETSRDGVICVRSTPRSPIKTTASALKRADRKQVDDELVPEERVAKLEQIVRELKREMIQQKKQAAALVEVVRELTNRAQSRAF